MGRRGVAFLLGHLREIEAPAQQSRRGAGLEAPEFNPGLEKASRQRFGAEITQTAAFVLVLADMHQPPQKRAGGHDDRSAAKFNIQIGPATDDFAVLEDQAGDGRLENFQIRLELEGVLQAKLVGFLVTLGARRLDGGTF